MLVGIFTLRGECHATGAFGGHVQQAGSSVDGGCSQACSRATCWSKWGRLLHYTLDCVGEPTALDASIDGAAIMQETADHKCLMRYAELLWSKTTPLVWRFLEMIRRVGAARMYVVEACHCREQMREVVKCDAEQDVGVEWMAHRRDTSRGRKR